MYFNLSIKNIRISLLFRQFSVNHKHENFISDLCQSKSTRIILFNKLNPVVIKNSENNKLKLLSISNEQYNKLNDHKGLQIFIGNNVPQVAVSYNHLQKNDLLHILKDKLQIDSSFMDNPLDFFKLVERDIWVKVRGLLAWHYNNFFCGLCGTNTVSTESGYKRICANPDCYSKKDIHFVTWANYPRIDPVVAVLPVTTCDPIKKLPACLLARKDTFPNRLMSVITGFIDPGESAEHAAQRELKEEVGLECHNLTYFSSEYWPMPSSLFITFSAVTPPSTDFYLDQNELSFAQWFNIDDIKLLLDNKHPQNFLPPKFSVLYAVIKDWYEKSKLS